MPSPSVSAEPLPVAEPGRHDGSAFSVARYRGRPLDRVSVRVGEWRLVDERLPHPRVRLLHHLGAEEREVDPATEPEVTARVARAGCRIYEVPISYHGRTYAEGKKIGWKDGVQALVTILRYAWFD